MHNRNPARMKNANGLRISAACLALGCAGTAQADDAAELAKKLSNPVASLISVPFQSNWDFEGGAEDEGQQYKLNFQPVIPIKLGDSWNMISRTIVPYFDQHDVLGNGTSEGGLGDITESLFFSPKDP